MRKISKGIKTVINKIRQRQVKRHKHKNVSEAVKQTGVKILFRTEI